ncbi:MAG TPA: pyrroloquinoline quinone-dependent dehydrogenase [Longimicrobiales bacterium]|nr:pyrroloquinoline quinone-dependent dehydrogenase [Longimicrobiales bacterium]
MNVRERRIGATEERAAPRRRVRRALLVVPVAAALVLAAYLLLPRPGPDVAIDYSGPTAGWSHYGGDPGGRRFSPLTQIDAGNVAALQVAWTYRSGDVSHGDLYPSRSSFQATPILFRGRLYLSTPFSRVVSLDPETGEELWAHDPGIDKTIRYSESLVSRGVEAWESEEADGPCAARILFGTLDARLLALDADTGRPCEDFGAGGQVDLSRDVGRVDPGEYEVTSPPVVVNDVVVVGSGIGDNRRVDVERGTIRGFDVRSGRLLWSWDPVPRTSDDPGWAAWNARAAERTGAGNAWAPLSADPERDLVFAPTGSVSPDFYGGERPGSGIYANSVVALRASTGERIWHFQVVHHDLWDYDIASQPTLATVRKDGRDRAAVVQPTKMGFVFILDRETGEPLWPVEERPVPPSDVPGEEAWPTQPFPTHPPPLHPLRFEPEDIWGLTFWDRGKCREAIEDLRYEGMFTPPSLDGTLQYPSMIGGANWGGAAVDEASGIMVLNMTRAASWVRLVPRERFPEVRGTPGYRGDAAAQEGTPYVMVREGILLSPWGMPCTRPPWGTLLAVDLGTGEKLWEVPLGTVRDLAPVPVPLSYGSITLGGPLVTGSGLVFIGAAMERALRAFDLLTGEELWSARMPAPALATPMTYRVRPDGRQYVVVAAGGHAQAPLDVSDHLIAFALPE